MPTPTTVQPEAPSQKALSNGIRDALTRIEHVNRKSAGYLKTLAFILHRVADADQDVSEAEISRMETILVDHASLSLPEAVLTVEIARHCRENADCARAYEASRRLRTSLHLDQRKQLQSFLASVAEADGTVLPAEKQAIAQIAAELGLHAA